MYQGNQQMKAAAVGYAMDATAPAPTPEIEREMGALGNNIETLAAALQDMEKRLTSVLGDAGPVGGGVGSPVQPCQTQLGRGIADANCRMVSLHMHVCSMLGRLAL